MGFVKEENTFLSLAGKGKTRTLANLFSLVFFGRERKNRNLNKPLLFGLGKGREEKRRVERVACE